MFFDEDTISAISTPLGEGGIGIIRISGQDAFKIAKNIFIAKKRNLGEIENRKLYLGNILDPDKNEIVDEVLVAFFKAPYTYTREDMVEINCHGGLTAQKKILELTIKYGARVAEPGEFTKRAFLNGRLDLSQAEAVIDIIRAKTDRALVIANRQLAGGLSKRVKTIREELVETIAHIEANLDFPEEDIPEAELEDIRSQILKSKNKVFDLLEHAAAGKILREGVSTLILGRPNVGKSSLLNALLKEERAIVTDVPGTTRDTIEEFVNIKGIPIKIIDTAGIRETEDKIEKIGVDRAMKYLQEAELVLLMIDASQFLTEDDKKIIKLIDNKLTVTVINKIDLPEKVNESDIRELIPHSKIVKISALTEAGIDELKTVIYEVITENVGGLDESSIILDERQKQILNQAYKSLQNSLEAFEIGLPIDLIQIDIRDAWEILGQITGDTVSDDIINTIFEKFCIGK